MQSCAITARGGPWCLTFAPRRLKFLVFWYKSYAAHCGFHRFRALGFLQFSWEQSLSQPSISMTTFLQLYFWPRPAPRKSFLGLEMAIGVFYSQVFLKFNTPISRFRGPPILQNFHAGKNVKNKNKQTKKPQGFARFWEAYVTKWWTPRIPGSGGPGFKPRPPRCFLSQQYVAGTHLYTWVKRDKVE